jgi:hypothetical protein
MKNEPSFDEVLAARKQSAAESLRPAAPEEAQQLLTEIFSGDPAHPWLDSFTRFVQDHQDETPYRGETSDGYSFVFYPQTARGMWYCFETRLKGVGIISEKNVKALSQLVK